MKYISLPVHERPDVIAGQISNFSIFFPDAIVVIHVSLGASFSGSDLGAYLDHSGVKGFLINPVSVKTDWGGIISAHLQNISFIKSRGDASTIVFHSSNDMLVRHGAYEFVDNFSNIFNWRRVYPGSHWWPGQVALQDELLKRAVSSYGAGLIVGSQIEGSSYKADLLFDIHDEIMRRGLLKSGLFYPREEILFSTLAACRGIAPEALPYIYSEVHVFDKYLWSCLDKFSFIFDRKSMLSERLKAVFNKTMFNSNFYKLTADKVEEVRRQDVSLLAGESLDDGNCVWKIYDHERLYGVKRVERDTNDPVRKYILSEVMK